MRKIIGLLKFWSWKASAFTLATVFIFILYNIRQERKYIKEKGGRKW